MHTTTSLWKCTSDAPVASLFLLGMESLSPSTRHRSDTTTLRQRRTTTTTTYEDPHNNKPTRKTNPFFICKMDKRPSFFYIWPPARHTHPTNKDCGNTVRPTLQFSGTSISNEKGLWMKGPPWYHDMDNQPHYDRQASPFLDAQKMESTPAFMLSSRRIKKMNKRLCRILFVPSKSRNYQKKKLDDTLLFLFFGSVPPSLGATVYHMSSRQHSPRTFSLMLEVFFWDSISSKVQSPPLSCIAFHH